VLDFYHPVYSECVHAASAAYAMSQRRALSLLKHESSVLRSKAASSVTAETAKCVSGRNWAGEIFNFVQQNTGRRSAQLQQSREHFLITTQVPPLVYLCSAREHFEIVVRSLTLISPPSVCLSAFCACNVCHGCNSQHREAQHMLSSKVNSPRYVLKLNTARAWSKINTPYCS
jgi:hypothetical protein